MLVSHYPKWIAIVCCYFSLINLTGQFENTLEIQEYHDESIIIHEIIKINDLNLDQLSAHPLIGSERALDIINHRSNFGPILGMEELLLCGFQPETLRKLKNQVLFHELNLKKSSLNQRLLWKSPNHFRLSGKAETLKYGKGSWFIEYDTLSQKPRLKSCSYEFKYKQINTYVGNILIQENQGFIASPPFPVGKLFTLGSWSYQSINFSRYGGSQTAPLGVGLQIPWQNKLYVNIFQSNDLRTFVSLTIKKLPMDIQWISSSNRQNHAHQISLLKPSFLGIRWDFQWAFDQKFNSAQYFSALGSLNSHMQWGLRGQRIAPNYQSPFFSNFKKSEIGKYFLSWGIDGKLNNKAQIQFRYHLYESLPNHSPIQRRIQHEIWALKSEFSTGSSHTVFKLAQTLNQWQISMQNNWAINDATQLKLGFLAINDENLGSSPSRLSSWVSAQLESSIKFLKIRAQVLTYQAPQLRIYAPLSLIYQPIGVISFKGTGHFYNLQITAKLARHWKLQFQYILLHKTQISDVASPEIPRIFVQLIQQ